MPTPPRFNDPTLQKIADYLTSGPSALAAAEQPAAIAAREGLDLGPELAAVLRRRPQRPRRTTGRTARPARRTQHSHAADVIRELAPHLKAADVHQRAAAWAQLAMSPRAMWPQEMQTWIRALGVDGARTAASCVHWGLPASSLEIVVDGLHVRRWLRDGEQVTAVHARAGQLGIDLHRAP